MTIHHSDPFATPDEERSPVRRFRGRLPSPVTVWTAGRLPIGTADGSAPGPVGLTVSSLLVADGDPGRVIGLIGDESELWTAIQDTGRFVVIQLGAADRQIADRFAGLLPAPGGPFRSGTWTQSDYGPVPGDPATVPGDPATVPGDAATVPGRESRTWAGCRLDSAHPYGWGLLVEASIEMINFGPAYDTLVHLGGRYRNVATP